MWAHGFPCQDPNPSPVIQAALGGSETPDPRGLTTHLNATGSVISDPKYSELPLHQDLRQKAQKADWPVETVGRTGGPNSGPGSAAD